MANRIARVYGVWAIGVLSAGCSVRNIDFESIDGAVTGDGADGTTGPTESIGGSSGASASTGGSTGRSVPGSGSTGQAQTQTTSPQVSQTASEICDMARGQRLFAQSNTTCFLDASGFPVCWGGVEAVNATPNEPLIKIAINAESACGLRPDCTVACWGSSTLSSSGAAVIPPPPGQLKDIAVGGGSTGMFCGMRPDGSALCWGVPNNGVFNPSPDALATEEFASIVRGNYSVCGLTTEGDAVCWGNRPPTPESGTSGPFKELAMGTHACGLRVDGTVQCWGNNNAGQASPPEGEFLHIAAKQNHSCGLRTDHSVACWGGLYTTPCWGSALCLVEPAYLAEPLQPPQGIALQSLVAGSGHLCGLSADGTAVCWGYGEASEPRGMPPYLGQATPPGGVFVELALGEQHSCGLRPGGEVVCWGAGQPGDPPSSYNQGQSTVPPLK